MRILEKHGLLKQCWLDCWLLRATIAEQEVWSLMEWVQNWWVWLWAQLMEWQNSKQEVSWRKEELRWLQSEGDEMMMRGGTR